MRIAVFGAGSVGGYFGGRLAQAGEDVVFIARGDHLKAIQTGGLRVESIEGDFVVQPAQASDDPSSGRTGGRRPCVRQGLAGSPGCRGRTPHDWRRDHCGAAAERRGGSLTAASSVGDGPRAGWAVPHHEFSRSAGAYQARRHRPLRRFRQTGQAAKPGRRAFAGRVLARQG